MPPELLNNDPHAQDHAAWSAWGAGHFRRPWLEALRTLKSDVVTGLSPATVAELDATGQPWRTEGNHGLIQLMRRDKT